MTEKPVQTIAGPFDRKRLSALKETLGNEDDDSVIMFEGRQLGVLLGRQIVDYVEVELGKRNTRGL